MHKRICTVHLVDVNSQPVRCVHLFGKEQAKDII